MPIFDSTVDNFTGASTANECHMDFTTDVKKTPKNKNSYQNCVAPYLIM